MDPFPGEDIQIFERDIPGQNLYGYSEQAISTVLPLETCQTMNRSWGYRITDTTYKSEEFLIKYLVQTAAKGANLLLNIGPRPDGTLPDESLQRLEAMGRWMDKFGETIYGTTAGIVPEQPWGVSTRKGHRNFLFVFKDTSEVFVPLEDTDVMECRDYVAGTHLEYRRVKGGIRISLGNAGAPVNGIRVVEFTYDPVDNEALEASVAGFLKKYPQATLQDVYKNNFQDYFGSAHIMAKREGVVRYLQQELEEMKQEGYLSGRGYYDPCGWRNNYYQVSLAVVADGLMTLDEFADAFIAGGGAVPEVTDEWMQEWKLIKKAVKKAAPAIVGYGKDAAAIDNLIKDGKYVVHHSNRYVETYKPHYRIMRRDIFNALVYPRIKASGKN